MFKIQLLSDISNNEKSLCDLLIDAVESGASIGFLSDIKREQAYEYWININKQLQKNKYLFVAYLDKQLVGSIQLQLAEMPNAKHRAEVQKLFVLQNWRNKGIAKILIESLETKARQLGIKLLVLDTRKGDVAENLYQKLGYERAGEIPEYVFESDGHLSATVLFYKKID